MDCKIEGCSEKYYGKGYCRYHYKWFVEAGHTEQANTNCLMCRKQIKRRRGSKFCSATCQMRWHRRYGCYAKEGAKAPPILKQGTEREAFRHKSPLACSMDECDQPSIALGLCEAHYRTKLRHGTTASPLGYGQRRKHPLYVAWSYQSRVKEGRVEAWEDFWQFVADVGEKPTERHMAQRHELAKPWGPDNFFWKECGRKSITEKEGKRIAREKHPLRFKDYDLRRNYGINIDDYLRLYESQKGKCAICGTSKESHNRENGRNDTLVVDHCHGSKKVRSLLCSHCNKALGGFKDSPEILANAIKYLKKHQASPP